MRKRHSELHTVRQPFLATQFPGGETMAVGIIFKALIGKASYSFKIQNDKKIYRIDVLKAISINQKHPPPGLTSANYLHKNKILIVPLFLCSIEDDKERQLEMDLERGRNA